jgi:ATP-dependent helicase/DNAse subunit B
VKSRLVDVLTAFQEKEREYFTRSGARVVSMEDRKLKLEYDDFAIVGTPDRIDEHPAGFFILDYKSSAASLPTGAEMVDQGLRLQLPFYALATKRETGKQVAGLQFIELNRKAGRSRGIFFKEFNGKDRGKLTATTAASKSLLNRAPDEVWSVLEERIAESARAYLSGVFDAAPKKRQSCDSCMTQDLCGFRRLTVETEEVLSE